MDNFTTIWNRVALRAGEEADSLLIKDMVTDAFQRLAERRIWSWRIGHSTLFPPVYDMVTGGGFGTGGFGMGGFDDLGNGVPDTLTCIPGSSLVTSTLGIFVPEMVGRQIRVGSPSGSAFPTYTIQQYLSGNQVLLDTVWIGPFIDKLPFIIFQCYFPMPDDFQSWISLTNTFNNYRLYTDVQQSDIDSADPQRVQTGITFCASQYDTYQNFLGSVSPVLQVSGFGSVPIAQAPNGYTYPQSSIYSIQIVAGGALGTAAYQWKQDRGPYGPSITTQTDGQPVSLNSGVQVLWPEGVYEVGNTFVIQANAEAVSGVIRYELWPRPINTPYAYPFLYLKKLPMLTDANPALPPQISTRGDVLLEMALEMLAMFPGTTDTRNPYFDKQLASMHGAKAEKLLNELELKDEDTSMRYMTYVDREFIMAPWMDGSWLQRHAIFAG